MAKISSYPENTAPDPEMFIPVERSPSVSDGKYKTKLGNLAIFPYRNIMTRVWTDFYGVTTYNVAPFTTSAISTGTIAPIANESNHPGIARVASVVANGGHAVGLGSLIAVLIGGGEVADFIFRCPTTTAIVVRLGFTDVVTVAAPADRAEINISGTTLSGICSSNSVASSTASTYAIVANTWYRARVVVNSDATLVTFYLYDSTGVLLWSDTVSSNIPTATGRETGFCAMAYKTSAGSANVLDLDWMAYTNTKALVR